MDTSLSSPWKNTESVKYLLEPKQIIAKATWLVLLMVMKMDTTGDSRIAPGIRNTTPDTREKAGSHLTTTKTVPIVPVIAMTAIFMTIFSAYADLEPERKECYYAY